MLPLNLRRLKITLFVGSWLLSWHASAFDAPTYFSNKCSSCHGIGTGDDVGPDLKGVADRRSLEWIVKFVQSSQAMIAAGDPVAVELFAKFKNKKMPDTELSADEIKQLVEFIRAGVVPEKAADSKSASDATPEDVKAGELLFSGVSKFKNGGASCISCHAAGNIGALGGGTLGPDLSSVYSSYKDKGLTKALSKIAFPTMAGIYENKPLTDDEVFQIKAYLGTVDKAGVVPAGSQKKFILIGIIGLLLILGAIDISYRKRRTKTLRTHLRRSK